MKPPELVVRRSRTVAGLNAAMAVVVMLGAFWFSLTEVPAGGTSWFGAAMVVVPLGFYAWQSIRHFTDTTPLMVVGPEGLALPRSADAIIPWSEIQRVGASRSFALVGGGRLDIELAPETFGRIRLGKRLMGEPLVKMAGTPFGVSLIAQGLDHRASDILAAITLHWPPQQAAPDAPG